MKPNFHGHIYMHHQSRQAQSLLNKNKISIFSQMNNQQYKNYCLFSKLGPWIWVTNVVTHSF